MIMLFYKMTGTLEMWIYSSSILILDNLIISLSLPEFTMIPVKYILFFILLYFWEESLVPKFSLAVYDPVTASALSAIYLSFSIKIKEGKKCKKHTHFKELL